MRHTISLIVGMLLVGAIGYYVLTFATAEGRVRKLCGNVHAGMPIAGLNRYAEGVGLGPPARATGTSFLVENKTLGRYGCKIEAADGVVRMVSSDASN